MVPVAFSLRVLGFSEADYYKWLKNPISKREQEDRNLIEELHKLHDEDPEAGYRLLSDDLAELGYRASERRVWRLCSIAGIYSITYKRKGRYKRTTQPVHDDLVERQFVAESPNKIWLTDITEHWTNEGKLYNCSIKDLFGNKIVGYASESRMKASLAVNALEMAVMQRGYPEGVIVHSDRGSQFGSKDFLSTLEKYNLKGSMGRVDACGDNASMESFFSLLQKNVLDRQTWRTRQELRLAIMIWIEGKCNRKRKQRRLGKLSPVEYELVHAPEAIFGETDPD